MKTVIKFKQHIIWRGNEESGYVGYLPISEGIDKKSERTGCPPEQLIAEINFDKGSPSKMRVVLFQRFYLFPEILDGEKAKEYAEEMILVWANKFFTVGQDIEK